MVNLEQLAKCLEPHGPEMAAMIRRPETRVEERATPFFRHGQIYVVTERAKYGPRTLVVGCADNNTVVFLGGMPQEFSKLSAKADVNLSTEELRLAYVRTYLETTRQFHLTFRILGEFSELKPPNDPTEQQRAVYKQYEEKYTPIIRPPTIAGSGPWQYTAYAQRGDSLVEITGSLAANGRIDSAEKVLETSDVIAYSH